MYRGSLDDVDTVTEPGLYETTLTTKNLPADAYKYGMLEVIQSPDKRLLLKRYTDNKGVIYTRMKWDKNLQKWVRHSGVVLQEG